MPSSGDGKKLFPARHLGMIFFRPRSAANKKIFFYFSLQYKYLYDMLQHGNVRSHISCFKVIYGSIGQLYTSKAHQPYIVTQKNKIMNFRRYLSLNIFQKNIFAAARMRFIFVTRCAGNEALFSFGLRLHRGV